MNGQVQSHQLDEITILSKAQLICQIEAVVLVLLNRSDLPILEHVAVDLGCDSWELCNYVH